MAISNDKWNELKQQELYGMVSHLYKKVEELKKRIEELEIALKSR